MYFKVGDTESRAKFFRDELVKLGPAFVKFGQVLSTREDVLPREYCEQLAELQDSMAPSGFGEFEGVFEVALRVRAGSGVRDV